MTTHPLSPTRKFDTCTGNNAVSSDTNTHFPFPLVNFLIVWRAILCICYKQEVWIQTATIRLLSLFINHLGKCGQVTILSCASVSQVVSNLSETVVGIIIFLYGGINFFNSYSILDNRHHGSLQKRWLFQVNTFWIPWRRVYALGPPRIYGYQEAD